MSDSLLVNGGVFSVSFFAHPAKKRYQKEIVLGRSSHQEFSVENEWALEVLPVVGLRPVVAILLLPVEAQVRLELFVWREDLEV
jgi:hypothetical protein